MDESVTLTDLSALDASGIGISLVDATRILDLAKVADRFLDAEELAQLATIPNAMRRRQWIAARMCLKSMVLRNGLIAGARSCRISKNTDGRPFLVASSGKPIPGVGDCSLSHKGRFACACLSRHASIRVGIDIEEISPRFQRLRGAFLNPCDTMSRADSADAELAALWTLKEAYSKMVGAGIHIGFRNLICDQDPETGALGVQAPRGARAHARHFVYNGHAIGVCFANETLLTSVKN